MSEIYRLLAGSYDALLGELAVSTWREGIVQELSRVASGSQLRVVDVGAGTGIGGRLMRAASAGSMLIGVDACREMLRLGASSYDGAVVAAATDLPLRSALADVIASGFDTLNYLAPEGLARFFHEARRCLRRSGWLLFDYSSPALLRDVWGHHTHDQRHRHGRLRWRHRYDSATDSCVTVLENFGVDDRLLWQERHVQYALDADGLAEIAGRACLQVERVRDLDRETFSPLARTHVWVLRSGG